MKPGLLLSGSVIVTAIAGCALPLWLLPDEDEPEGLLPREVGPLRDTGVRPRADSGFDGGRPDTFRPDTGAPSCAAPLPASFTCEPLSTKAGETVCTDAMLTELIAACFGSSATSARCADASAKHPECAACAVDRWIHQYQLDSAACVRAIDPESSCADVVRCTNDCLTEVCSECDWRSGTGTDGGSEGLECESAALRKDGGSCATATTGDYEACAGDPRFSPCFVRTMDDVVVFLRGACRDGGKWAAAAPDAATDGAYAD